MRNRRTRSVTARVTDAEYATFQQLAGERGLGEWAREMLRHEAGRTYFEEAVLAELLALRAIVLNVQYAVANGTAPSAATMREFIAHADEDKLLNARDHLAAASPVRRIP